MRDQLSKRKDYVLVWRKKLIWNKNQFWKYLENWLYLSLPTALVLIFFIFYKKANLAFSEKKMCNLLVLDSMANGAHAIYGIEKSAVSINFQFGTEYLTNLTIERLKKGPITSSGN